MNKLIGRAAILVLGVGAGISCSEGDQSGAEAQAVDRAPVADTIYFGGDIITMEGAAPAYVEAVSVTDGEISFVGARTAALAMAGETTQRVDLDGRTLIPGFIDSHSHFILTAVKLATVNLDPPPAGSVESIAEILDALREALQARTYDDQNWLFGWGYDTAMLEDSRHPTKADLDLVSSEVPIVLLHFSTHMVAVNSKALELLGIDENSVAPEGGVIRRMPDGKAPNGVLEEQAIYPVFQRLRAIAQGERLVALMDEAQEVYLSKGFTTALEFGAMVDDVGTLEAYAASGKLKLDLIAAVMALSQGAGATAGLRSDDYKNHFRVAGGKINLDGGSPGRTAFLPRPLFHAGRRRAGRLSRLLVDRGTDRPERRRRELLRSRNAHIHSRAG